MLESQELRGRAFVDFLQDLKTDWFRGLWREKIVVVRGTLFVLVKAIHRDYDLSISAGAFHDPVIKIVHQGDHLRLEFPTQAFNASNYVSTYIALCSKNDEGVFEMMFPNCGFVVSLFVSD